MEEKDEIKVPVVMLTFFDDKRETLCDIARRAFKIANEMGLDGIKLSNLRFQFADEKIPYDPLNQRNSVGYEKSCSQEEYDAGIAKKTTELENLFSGCCTLLDEAKETFDAYEKELSNRKYPDSLFESCQPLIAGEMPSGNALEAENIQWWKEDDDLHKTLDLGHYEGNEFHYIKCRCGWQGFLKTPFKCPMEDKIFGKSQ